MPNAPAIKSSEWLFIKTSSIPKKALVISTRIQDGKSTALIIYLDDKKRKLVDDVYWTGHHWEFLNNGPTGTLAEAVPAAQQYLIDFELGIK